VLECRVLLRVILCNKSSHTTFFTETQPYTPPSFAENVTICREGLARHKIYLCRACPATETEPAHVGHFPGAIFGNRAYAAKRQLYFDALGKVLDEMITIKGSSMNAFFITTTYASCQLDYPAEDLTYVFKGLKKHGMVEYLSIAECTVAGRIHYHTVVVFEQLFKCFKDKKGVMRSDEVRSLCQELWKHGFVDVRGVWQKRRADGGSVAGYMLKEIMKQSCGVLTVAEDVIKKLDAGKALSSRDKKIVNTCAYVYRTGRRTLRVSKRLASAARDEASRMKAESAESEKTIEGCEAGESDLIHYRNNSSEIPGIDGTIICEFMRFIGKLTRTDMREILQRPPPVYGFKIWDGTPEWGRMVAHMANLVALYLDRSVSGRKSKTQRTICFDLVDLSGGNCENDIV